MTTNASGHRKQQFCLAADKQALVDVVVVYRTQVNTSKENMKELVKFLVEHENAVIVGDFNCPELQWRTTSNGAMWHGQIVAIGEEQGDRKYKDAEKGLVEARSPNGGRTMTDFYQWVRDPTRRPTKVVHNILDLVFTQTTAMVAEVVVLPPIKTDKKAEASDHNAIGIRLNNSQLV
jgi:hypothetical protein